MVRTDVLTPQRWDDFAALCRQMGPNRSCWCMYWRQDARHDGSARDRARALVAASPHPVGVLAYAEEGDPIGSALLDAAVGVARDHGAGAVEGVPGDPATRARSASASYTGTVGLFRDAGFRELARRTPKGRVVMRKELG